MTTEMKNARVSRLETRIVYGPLWPDERRGTTSVVLEWVAEHDCGDRIWKEWLTEWHNAFTAAYHHVQHDCKKKKQPSSGQWVVRPENEGGMEKHPYPIYDSLFQNVGVDKEEVDILFRRAGGYIRDALKREGYSE